MAETMKNLFVIGGPNGAGKTTSALFDNSTEFPELIAEKFLKENSVCIGNEIVWELFRGQKA